MGMFDTKYVHHVGTSVSRLVEDKNIVSTLKASSISSNFNGQDLIDTLLENARESIGIKHRAIYNYGKNKYTPGLPSGEIYSNTQGGPQVQAVLDRIAGQSVLVKYRRFGPANGIHIGWMKIIEQLNYDTSTNELKSLESAEQGKAYLSDMVFEVPASWRANADITQLKTWGIPANSGNTPNRRLNYGVLSDGYFSATQAVVNNNIMVPRIRVDVVFSKAITTTVPGATYEDLPKQVITYPPETRYINLPDFPNGEKEYFHAMYEVVGKPFYWMYEYGSGIEPTLDAVFTDSPEVIGDFYPNIYFRLNKQSFNANKEEPRYKTAKALCKKLGIDYDLLAEGIEENPDVEDVESAFIKFAVPADTTNKIELQYLYEFFDKTYAASLPPETTNTINLFENGTGTLIQRVKSSTEDGTTQAFLIQDAFFKMVLVNNGIFKTRVRKVIGEVGTVQMSSGAHTYTVPGTKLDLEGNEVAYDEPRSVKYRRYTKQISTNYCDEIEILNLSMRYYVFENYRATLGDDDGEILLVPLDYGIVKNMSFIEAEELLTRGMHVVFNSHVIQKLKWYQQEWFGLLIMIVGIVLSVISLGSDGGFFASAASAYATGGTIAVISLIALNVIKFAVFSIAFKLFVKAVGADIALLVAVITAVYGGWKYLQSTTEAMAATSLQFLQVANGLTKAISDEMRSLMGDLTKEFQEFDALHKERMAELESAQQLLDKNNWLVPLIMPGQTPKEYFDISIHSGNIGTLVLADAHYFVERSLKLPTFASSVEGFQYGD